MCIVEHAPNFGSDSKCVWVCVSNPVAELRAGRERERQPARRRHVVPTRAAAAGGRHAPSSAHPCHQGSKIHRAPTWAGHALLRGAHPPPPSLSARVRVITLGLAGLQPIHRLFAGEGPRAARRVGRVRWWILGHGLIPAPNPHSLDGTTTQEERFALSMQVLGHRHVATSPVSVNPQFDETFLCAVQALAGGEQQGPPAELRGLLRLVDPLRICVVRLDPHGKV